MYQITPKRIRTVAAQSGFWGLVIGDGNIVRSLIWHRTASFSQEIGHVRDPWRLIDFCDREGIQIEDDRTIPVPEWREDPWIQYGV